MTRTLLVRELAEELRIPLSRAYELLRKGVIPGIRLGRQIRVSREALDQFLAEGGRVLPAKAGR